MRILIAPDKFKGTLSATSAALAIGAGIREVHPQAEMSSIPVADGGGGTLDTLLDAVGGQKTFVTTCDPWAREMRAPVGALSNGDACIETATETTGDPLIAGSEGVGRAIAGAARLIREDGRVLVAIGGTASTDGGVGLARVLGWRFLDEHGSDLPPGGGALNDLRRIEPPEEPLAVQVVGLCDVDSHLVGPAGSARTFAPQKGASPDQVERLEAGLENLADVIERDIGVDVRTATFSGAGGGIAAGLKAFLGAELTAGFDYVASALHLPQLIGLSDYVVTGEGRFDTQSLRGKAPVGVARRAHEAGIPCLGIFGELAVQPKVALSAGFSDVMDLLTGGGPAPARDPFASVARGASALFRRQPV